MVDLRADAPAAPELDDVAVAEGGRWVRHEVGCAGGEVLAQIFVVGYVFVEHAGAAGDVAGADDGAG